MYVSSLIISPEIDLDVSVVHIDAVTADWKSEILVVMETARRFVNALWWKATLIWRYYSQIISAEDSRA